MTPLGPRFRGLLVVVAVAGALPGGAAAEQASQPASAAAGGLDVGRYHACALLPSATVRCWGYGADGALGYGTTASIGDDETPAAAGPVNIGAGRTATALATGSFHTCALLDTRTVRCWGYGGNGRLGYGNESAVGDNETPDTAGPVALGGTAKAIAAGDAHTCAVLDGGAVRCWGFGFDGRLGYGSTANVGDTPTTTPDTAGSVNLGLGRTATAITAGSTHTCALLDDGTVRCWGANGIGQLGYGNKTPIGDNPTTTPDTAGPVMLGAGRTVAISAGNFHTCALREDGTVRCWGNGANGRLGYGNTTTIGDDETPDTAGPVNLGLGRTAVAISAGAEHTCALLDNGTVLCWGKGANGRLGYAGTSDVGATPTTTPDTAGPVDLGAGRTAVAISAGWESTCARLDNGSVRCWGNGANGILGSCNINTIGDNETPGSAGPINLEPGDGGAGCAVAVAQPSVPSTAPPPALAAPGSLLPLAPDRLAAALAAQRIRAIALRRCLRAVSRRAHRQRRGARLLPARARAVAFRQIARRARRGRAHCLRRYGRTPGRVSTFDAVVSGPHTIVLTFRAAGNDHTKPPAAHSYLIKQSTQPIRTPRDFHAAHALCHGTCSFAVTNLGATIRQKVTGLDRRRVYYYSIAARDNVSARVGPRSRTVAARTR